MTVELAGLRDRGRSVSKAEVVNAAPESGYQTVSQEAINMPFQPGDVVAGKYEINDLIGTGGMGFVFSATHVELGEKVALKFLRPECTTNEELVGRFAREARASVKIKSEYVARVFDVGTLPDGVPFIVMEYLEGKDLFEVVREQGALPIKLAVEYVMQACEALAVAHASGVVHRDIKPENLFLTQRAQGMDIVKVLDFGISKVALTGSAFEHKMPLVQTMMPMGSPVYMSPEQIRASKDIDARTDIWSLGCVLYELLTGTAAFDAPSLTQLSATILEQSAPPLRALCPNAPLELEAIILRCLEKDPARRFHDVGELAIALYPFAPRRARISAERCCYVLKSAGLSNAEFELPSVMPPGGVGPESETNIPLAPSVMRSSPTAPVIAVETSRAAPAPSSSGSRWAFVALAAALAAGAYAFWIHRSVASVTAAETAPAAAAAAATPPPAAAAPSPAAPAAPLSDPQPGATGSAQSAPLGAGSATLIRGASSAARPRPAPAPRAKPATPAPARTAAGGRDELDVGF
jgi:eukaryotic-like serine/threonine-protein kinase